ncbi:MAG: DUF4410 domain-containing protein [Neisseria sp.]|nr:DUF4410 domain-containing protein [Neisseria sp.]
MRALLSIIVLMFALTGCASSKVHFEPVEQPYSSYRIKDISDEHIDKQHRLEFVQYLQKRLNQMGYQTGDDLEFEINILNYDKGNRALRYLVGFGAGKATAQLSTSLIDTKTGKVVGKLDTKAKLSMGLFGGDAGGVLFAAADDIIIRIQRAGILEKKRKTNNNFGIKMPSATERSPFGKG